MLSIIHFLIIKQTNILNHLQEKNIHLHHHFPGLTPNNINFIRQSFQEGNKAGSTFMFYAFSSQQRAHDVSKNRKTKAVIGPVFDKKKKKTAD